jgi:hypothetical protein
MNENFEEGHHCVASHGEKVIRKYTSCCSKSSSSYIHWCSFRQGSSSEHPSLNSGDNPVAVLQSPLAGFFLEMA